MNEKWKDRDWLYQKYVVEKLSRKKIAEECGVKEQTIEYWMNKFGIKARTRSESLKIYYGFDTEKIRKEFAKEGYTLLTKKYVNCYQKLVFICPNGHKGTIKWNDFQQGHRCAECAGLKKHSLREVKEAFEKEGYTLLSSSYCNNKQKLVYLCPNGHIGKIHFNSWVKGERCRRCYEIGLSLKFRGENNPMWRGGVKEKNLPLYDTYAHQLDWCEEVRRDPDNEDLLQVRCTNSNCRKWFTPKRGQVRSRLYSIKTGKGECRFYCSEECKRTCSIYGKRVDTILRDSKLQGEWREMVLERDGFTCQICGKTDDLIAHHIEGIVQNPIMSTDIENGITVCRECHERIHKEEGCRRIDLTRKSLC